IHYFLKTLYDSVLTEAFPQIMLPSFFSVAFLYTIISFIYFIVYFALYYDFLTFTEIGQNRWYALVKLGYKPTNMILQKILARVIYVFSIYTIGYIFALILTAFLKYPFIISYLLPLYVSGLIDLLFFVSFVLALSIFTRDKVYLRLGMVSGLLITYILRVITGYSAVFTNRSLMQDINNVISSWYFYIIIFLILLLTAFCIFAGKKAASRYTPITQIETPLLVKDYKTKKFVKVGKGIRYNSKALTYMINSIGVLLLIFVLAINGFILFMSLSSTNSSFTVGGKIPYIFQSSTLEPEIKKNDLIVFQKVDEQYPLTNGEIVIFEINKEVFIEKIMETKEDGTLIVDITNYLPGSEVGIMRQAVDRDQIYGIYYSYSRWLGALILFANSIIGRIIMFIIPIFILFFEKNIRKFIEKRRRNFSDVKIQEIKIQEGINYFNLIEDESSVQTIENIDDKLDKKEFDSQDLEKSKLFLTPKSYDVPKGSVGEELTDIEVTNEQKNIDDSSLESKPLEEEVKKAVVVNRITSGYKKEEQEEDEVTLSSTKEYDYKDEKNFSKKNKTSSVSTPKILKEAISINDESEYVVDSKKEDLKKGNDKKEISKNVVVDKQIGKNEKFRRTVDYDEKTNNKR
ncbi:MAG: ABC transporter permease, partial [Bacilli bacterium]|nr:ABC transporter permease [Bacilli bacterium]